MKLLFFSGNAHLILDEASTRTSGGAELQVALLARQLAHAGHDVVLAGGDSGQPDRVTLQGVKTRNAGKFHTGNLLEMLGSIPRVVRVLRDERPDWVVVQGWTAWLFVLWVLRRFLGYRLDFTCALDSEINGAYRRENPVFGTLFEFAVRHCDARHAITRDQMDCFARRGMDSTLYRYLVFPRTRPLTAEKRVDFLWVSRCQPVKRPHLFVELARALPGASFEMICPPENRTLWEEVARAAAFCPNLQLIESVPYHKIQEHYDRARIFVNTSEWEGWPNSFIQAGLGETAILSLTVNPDGIIGRFQMGFHAGGDSEKFFQTARDVLSDPPRIREMQLEAARFVAEMHDNEKETLAFLAGITGRGSELVSAGNRG